MLTKKFWFRNKELYVWIFNVGRGFCAFVKTPDNYGIMIDCGCSENFKPFKDVIQKKFLPLIDKPKKNFELTQLIVSHPHSDHCSEVEDVINLGIPMLLTTPHSNEKESDENMFVNWELVSNPEHGEKSVEFLKNQINKRLPPLREYVKDLKISIPDYEFKIFYIPPKVVEKELPVNDYTNNLSIIVYIKMNSNSILFMGDIMPSGCEYLIKYDKEFREILKNGVSIFVAPHHGLESAFYEDIFNYMPNKKVKVLHIISEKKKAGESEGKTDSRYFSNKYCSGLESRFSLSTKKDGHIRLVFGAGGKLNIRSSQDFQELLS